MFTFIEYFFFGIKTQLFVLNHFHFIYTFIHLTVLLFSFCLIPFWIFASYIFDIWLEKFIEIERKKVENINKQNNNNDEKKVEESIKEVPNEI